MFRCFIFLCETDFFCCSACAFDMCLLNYLLTYLLNRVVPVWNSLPNNVVMADNINIFKNRLDKFWSSYHSYDFVYLFRAQPLDTGSAK